MVGTVNCWSVLWRPKTKYQPKVVFGHLFRHACSQCIWSDVREIGAHKMKNNSEQNYKYEQCQGKKYKSKICIKMSHSKPETRVVNMQKTSPRLVLHVTHLSQTVTGEFSFKNPKSNLLNMQRMDAHLVPPHTTHPLLVLIALTNTTKGDRGGGCFFPKYFMGTESKHCLLFM